MKRVALLCPGRGSYTERSLGSLPKDERWVLRAEQLRAETGLPSLLELDGASKFDPKVHLAPENASLLIWLVSILDSHRALDEHEVVCIAGNSMGWYTALVVSGVLSFEDGFHLVQRMALLQKEHQEEVGGGQILFPIVGDDWREDPERRAAVEQALATSHGESFPSIHLGGYEVLAGSEDGIKHLLGALPRVQLGKNPYPFRLMQHGAYHTRLLEPVAERARDTLGGLEFHEPKHTLIDGQGRSYSPWSTDPAEIASYTLGEQVVTPYDFSASVEVALREYAPEHLVCPGPGNTLGGVCGQILVRTQWSGIQDKAAFEQAQKGERPPLISMRRA